MRPLTSAVFRGGLMSNCQGPLSIRGTFLIHMSCRSRIHFEQEQHTKTDLHRQAGTCYRLLRPVAVMLPAACDTNDGPA